MPGGGAGKRFMNEMTRLLNAWTMKSPMRPISLKLIMIMPPLLLQKTSPTSKAKEHTEALKRRLDLWDAGKLDELLFEATSIQKRLKAGAGKNDVNNISRRFAGMMRVGNVSGAVKLITENADGGVLPLDQETIRILQAKHPEAPESEPSSLMEEEIVDIHPSVYDTITSAHIQEAARRTKGSLIKDPPLSLGESYGVAF